MNLLENASNSFLISDKKNHNQMKCVNEYSETIYHSSKVREFQVNGEALIFQEPLLHSVASHQPVLRRPLSFPVRPAHEKTNSYFFATILHLNFVSGGFEAQLTQLLRISANNRDIEVYKVI